MQKCAFCEFDYGEMTLQEGRCPQCGSIVEWPSEPEPIPSVPPIAIPMQLPLPITREAEQKSTEIPSLATTESSSPSDAAPVPQNEKPNSVPINPSQNEALSSSPSSVDALWSESVVGSSDVRCTLKGANSEVTISDSVFSILPREVRSPLHVTDTPVDYELLDIIGQGGVGVVYTARQASIDRTVAVKMLREEYRSRNDHKEKFLAEAVLTGELDHPNIVPIYDLGRNGQGELFYSMKNVIGTPWDKIIAQKSLRENIDILLKVSDAIAFAHSRSVIHRDIKPENVMLGNFGEVLVMDWGIALPTEGFRSTSSILRSQAMGGTPAYMAPELATGPVDSIGPPADIYLLGAVLFEILTGTPPHGGNDVMECVRNAAENVILETTVTGELMEIAIRAMATLPRRRFKTVQTFQAAIRLYQSHSESITLSESAETELNQAIESKDYKGFSRAIFAFEEALSLWDENDAAKSGLSKAKSSYASAAYEKGDYDLGLSMLDESEIENRALVKKLKSAIKDRETRQNRLKTIRKLAVLLAGFIIVAGSIAMSVILKLYSELGASASQLRGEYNKTADALKLADQEREKAIAAGNEAQDKRREAETARRGADLARLETVAQKQRAEENSYFAEIALVGASIQQNQFSIAAEVLAQQEKSPPKSKIRHWEWGRHRYMVRGGSIDDAIQNVENHPTDESVETIDCSSDGNWIAVGKMSGECELWKQGAIDAIRIVHGRSITDLDFDSSGNFLATSGLDEDNKGCVCIWKLQGDLPPVLERKLDANGQLPTTVCFSNDARSQWVAVGDNKRVGRVWNWTESRQITALLGHIDAITSIDFSVDSKWIATSSLDGTVRVWHADRGTEVQRFSGHAAAVFALSFSPDGKTIASAGAEGRVLVWNVDTDAALSQRFENVRKQVNGEEVALPSFASLVGHNATVQDLSFSKDGKKLVTCGNDNVVCVWNVQDVDSKKAREPVVRLRGHGGWVRACRMMPNQSEVVTGGDDRTWKKWNFGNYSEKQVLGDGRVAINDACFSPQGNLVATAHADGTISIWDTTSESRVATFSDGHEYLTNKAMLIPDRKLLATAAGDNSLRLWDVNKGTQVASLSNAGRDGIFAISLNGKWLVAGGDESGVRVWNIESPADPVTMRVSPSKESNASPTLPGSAPVNSVTISDDGKHVVIGDKQGNIEFWDVDRKEMREKVTGHSEAIVACFFIMSQENSANSTFLTVSSDGSAGFWDYESGKQQSRDRLQHFAPLQRAAISSDGKYLVSSASLDQGTARVWLWDLTKGERLGVEDFKNELIQDLVCTTAPNLSVCITTSNSESSKKTVWNWGPDRGKAIKLAEKVKLSDSTWGAIPLSEETLLTYGGKGARLWKIRDGAELQSYRPLASIGAVAFSGDDQKLASASDDGSIVVWDIAKKVSVHKLSSAHSGAVKALAYLDGDNKIVSSGADGRLVVWDVKQGKAIDSGKIAPTNVAGNSLALSNHGDLLVVGCDDNSIRFYDPKTLSPKQILTGHSGPVTCSSLSADGHLLVSGSLDKTIRIWSVASGKELTKLLGHSASITSVSFSNDSLRVLSTSQDTTARLWDLDRISSSLDSSQSGGESLNANLGEVLSLEHHTKEVTAGEFAPDGRYILTASADGKFALWPSERVPVALRLSNPNVSYTIGSGLKRIDPSAMISMPSSLDLDGAILESRFDSDVNGKKRLLLDTSDNKFTIQDSTILLRTHGREMAIGTYQEMDDGGLAVRFNRNATHANAEQLVRHVAFELIESPDTAQCEISISITDRHGSSGNAESERITVSLIDDSSK